MPFWRIYNLIISCSSIEELEKVMINKWSEIVRDKSLLDLVEVQIARI